MFFSTLFALVSNISFYLLVLMLGFGFFCKFILLVFVSSLTGFLQNLRWPCCGGSCLNSVPGDVINRKPRHCMMGARWHLKVSPHKGKNVFPNWRKPASSRTSCCSDILDGIQLILPTQPKEVEELSDACRQDSKFLAGTGSNYTLDSRNFT